MTTPAGPRTTYTLVGVLSGIAGAATGIAGFYAVDRFRMLWGATVRETRWAGWLDKHERRAAA